MVDYSMMRCIRPKLCLNANSISAVLSICCTLPKGHEGNHETEYSGGKVIWSDPLPIREIWFSKVEDLEKFS